MFDSVYLGGTTDITVHQLEENNTLAELVPVNGGEWGGINVDKAYRQFLEDIFGSSVLEKFESDPDNIIDYYEFWQNFEVKKRVPISRKTSRKISLVIPLALIEIVKEQMRIKGNFLEIMKTCLRESKYCDTGIYSEAGKLMLPIEFFETFFSPAINELVDHLSKMFGELDLTDVKTILFVGGFSECELMRDRLKRHFGHTKKLVFPDEASLAVLKGAVYFGHCKDLVSHRVAEFTYGFEIWPKFDESKHSIDRKIMVNGEERCRGVFLKIVTKGDPITPNLKKSLFFKPLEKEKNVHECDVFASSQRNPTYVDDPGCAKLGTLQIPLTKCKRQINTDIELSIIFGETYIKVMAYNFKTQQVNEINFDFLSPEIHLPSSYIGSC